MTLVASQCRVQVAARRVSKAGQEPMALGMSSNTPGPEETESASLSELAAEASELEEDVGFFTCLAFLDGCLAASASAESGCAPPSPGLRI
jgi:hypothetical protein